MASGLIIDYLGSGVIADRPASLDLYAGSLGLWYATDTEVMSVWDGSAWTNVTSGSATAIVETIVAGAGITVDSTDPANPIVAASGAAPAWGDITGTLFSQSDLQAALNAKAPAVVDVVVPANSSGTVTLDFAGRSKYVGAITLSANVSTLAFSNLPGAGKYAEYELHISQDGTGSRTFAIPASHKALGGSDTSIASAANAVTVLTASSVDNGTTWRYAMQESA